MLLILGEIVPYSVPVALSPLPAIAVLMIVLAPAGNRGGVCFLAGRLGALILLVLLFSLLVGWMDETAGNRGSRVWLRFAVGVLLLAVALKTLRKPAKAGEDLPGWMLSLQEATPARAAVLGAMLTAVNVKELALVAGASIVLAAAELPLGQTLALAIVFAALSALGVGLPVALTLVVEEERKASLAVARDWLLQNRDLVIAGALAVIAAMLIGGALSALGGAPY